MNRTEFTEKWTLAKRRGSSIVWSFYISGLITFFFVIAGLLIFICSAPFWNELRDLPQARVYLQIKALWAIGYCTVLIGGIFLAEACFWFWLRSIGMQCPQCRHYLTCHMGDYTTPHKPDFCTVCIDDGRCLNVVNTGLCAKCGHRIFNE